MSTEFWGECFDKKEGPCFVSFIEKGGGNFVILPQY